MEKEDNSRNEKASHGNVRDPQFAMTKGAPRKSKSAVKEEIDVGSAKRMVIIQGSAVRVARTAT